MKTSGLRLRPTMPIGRYLSYPMSIECKSVEEIRQFLCTCTYVSDMELFGKEEYWQPPEEFEQERRGDCEDFALWTWRQLLQLGYDARLAIGAHGRYMAGHAWVFLYESDKVCLVEPQYAWLGTHLPALSTIWYRPVYSVGWNGSKPIFYRHDISYLTGKSVRKLQAPDVITAIPDWFLTFSSYWCRHPTHLPKAIFRSLRFIFSSQHAK